MGMNTLQYLCGMNGPSGFGSSSTASEIAEHYASQIQGRTVIITGANTGSGKELTRCLAKYGAKVIMACRNMAKCKAAIDTISREIPHADLIPMECDLSSFASVRQFAKNFQQLDLPLHILINNAGVMACPKSLTEDGYEQQFGSNHLGHFLLTELLIDDLKRGAPSRVVILSSCAHNASYKEGIRFDDLKAQKEYQAFPAYGQSKLANLLHAKELNERFQAKNLQITANAVHPGVFNSELGRHMSSLVNAGMVLFRPIFKSIPQGSATTLFVALAPELAKTGGRYFADCNEVDPAIPMANDSTLWRKLRDVSKQLTQADAL